MVMEGSTVLRGDGGTVLRGRGMMEASTVLRGGGGSGRWRLLEQRRRSVCARRHRRGRQERRRSTCDASRRHSATRLLGTSNQFSAQPQVVQASVHRHFQVC